MLYYELHFGSNLSVTRESLKLPKKITIITRLNAFSRIKNIKLQFNYRYSFVGNNQCHSLKSEDIYRVQEALALGYRLEFSNHLSKFQPSY